MSFCNHGFTHCPLLIAGQCVKFICQELLGVNFFPLLIILYAKDLFQFHQSLSRLLLFS